MRIPVKNTINFPESKWKDVKDIKVINDEIEHLDVYDNYIGLGCSRYLNDASEKGEIDMEEMFRNCRELEKVRQTTKKKEERKEKVGKGRRGAGFTTDKKLLEKTINETLIRLEHYLKHIKKYYRGRIKKLKSHLVKNIMIIFVFSSYRNFS